MQKKTYEHVIKMACLAKKAAQAAIRENRELGLPSPFIINGRIYYEMPDGRLVNRKPKVLSNPTPTK